MKKTLKKLSPPGTTSRAKGNMLVMVGWCTFSLVLLIALGLSLQYYFSSDKNLQYTADRLTMTTALNLNYNDHIGQMNNLVANSRELVFNSRGAFSNAAENCPHLSGLANRFMVEARQGSDAVEQARQGLISITLNNVRTSLQIGAKNVRTMAAFPWSTATIPEIVNVRVGTFKNLESNVLAPTGNDELLKLDTKSGYIDTTTNLYYGNSSLRLPEDPDKSFYLTALSPPVNGVVAPAKLTNAENFLRSLDIIKDRRIEGAKTCQQLPTAVQIDMQTSVKNHVVVDVTNGLTVDSTAVTNGASPTQK